jgi:hypothetical protein
LGYQANHLEFCSTNIDTQLPDTHIFQYVVISFVYFLEVIVSLFLRQPPSMKSFLSSFKQGGA